MKTGCLRSRRIALVGVCFASAMSSLACGSINDPQASGSSATATLGTGSATTATPGSVDTLASGQRSFAYGSISAVETAAASQTVSGVSNSGGALNALPLVQSEHLKYAGAFRLPGLPYTGQVCDGLSYSGRGLAFDPQGDGGRGSLFMTGHERCGGKVAEISVPEAVSSPRIDDLRRAQLLQIRPTTVPDALEGKLSTSGIAGNTSATVNGLFVWGDRLIISAGNDYAYSQPVSHWVRPKNLTLSGQVSNPVAVIGSPNFTGARGTAGYMCHVPKELQSSLGGPALTGWVAESIVSATSDGPAAFSFDPSAIGTSPTARAKTLLYYSHGNSLEASASGKINEVWNWTSMTRGCAIPNGTRSVLFLGSHGTGIFQYGVGGANGYTTGATRVPIYDPSDNSTGEHAWPYRYQVWAYDALDLAKVNGGTMAPYVPRPYAVWRFELPLENQNDRHSVGGVAYDPRSGRLFFVQQSAARFGETVIHVFTVTNAAVDASS